MNLNDLITRCRDKKEVFEPELKKIVDKYPKEKSLTFEGFIEKLEKLQDHIGLEEQRFLFTQKREAKIFSSRIEEFSRSTEALQYNMEEKSTRLENNLTTSVISVLGIFAAFITTFFGGLNVFGSIMSSLNDTSKFRVVFAILLLGFILFNIGCN